MFELIRFELIWFKKLMEKAKRKEFLTICSFEARDELTLK